jgi:hypothetical protein
MMDQATPKRVVLRCPERYFRNQAAMVIDFFKWQDLQNEEDYFTHICYEPSSPSKLFLVLDLHCNRVPNVDLSSLEHQIFQVSKTDTLYVIFTFH